MKSPMPSSRRQFLKLSGLASAASLLPASQIACAADHSGVSRHSGKTARNLIFLVADGLCHGTIGLAYHWKLRNEGVPLHWMQLLKRGDLHRATQDTASANSPVTDSAAAGSAWGCGQRINNGAINTDPSGKSLKPILRYAKEAGKATGLVTTCRLTHATPAAFVASVPERDQEDAIARQYLEHEVDVLLGGGARHFLQKQPDGSVVDFVPRFQSKGYGVVTDATELGASTGHAPLLGLFSQSHIPYAIDRENAPSLKSVPGLEAMFRSSLDRLGKSKDGFVLQVEGGRVDHAGHGNDPAAILREFLEFDACIPIALEYIEAHPDTLLIVTTDHGTGGCQLDGAGDAYLDSGPALDRINEFSCSYEWLQKRFTENGGQFDRSLISKNFGIEPTDAQAAIVQEALDSGAKYLSGALKEAFGEQINERTAVGWSSSRHTSECTDLFAFGPGAEAVPPFLKNSEVFGLMTSALGLKV